MNNSLQGLAVLFGAVSVPGSNVPDQDAVDGAGVEIPRYLRGYPDFQTVSALPFSPLSQYAAPRSGPW